MGASNSRLDEDITLQLCHTRKKLIKNALNGRFSLAEAHSAYTEKLKDVGSALRSFVDSDDHDDSPKSVSPLRDLFTEKSVSHSPQVDASANIQSSPSSTFSFEFKSHHVRFRSEASLIIEEKLDSGVKASTTPHSVEWLEESSFQSVPPESGPWDYFALSHPVDGHLSLDVDKKVHVSDATADAFAGELHDEEKVTKEIEESQFSEDEFDETPSSALVRSFSNINGTKERGTGAGTNEIHASSEIIPSEIRSSAMENVIDSKEDVVNGDLVKESMINGDSPVRSPKSVIAEAGFADRNNQISPVLSPLRVAPSTLLQLKDVNIKPMKHNEGEYDCVPKDFVSSIKDIQHIFFKASESGKEVPKMLEANKYHFRPVLSGRESGPFARVLLKAFLRCGKDPVKAPQGPTQNSVTYLRWHRTNSSRSASSRFLVGTSSDNTVDPASHNPSENFYMTSGSHVSTLDRLQAWEKKLYYEVKAAQLLRSMFDQKCKILRQEESRAVNTDKTRALVKDLHSRVGVGIHTIETISKKIEEIRDLELQPQLEELIEGLQKMWVTMMACHKLQFHIISISHPPGGAAFSVPADHRRQMAIHLENELNSLSSAFTEWTRAQKNYIEMIDKWLQKCFWSKERINRRRKRIQADPLKRNLGPPIYTICDDWLKIMEPDQNVVESIKDLVSEVSHFLPRQEKKTGSNILRNRSSSFSHVASDETLPSLDRFHISLTTFLGQISSYSEECATKYTKLQEAIQEAKKNYQPPKSLPQDPPVC